MRLYRSSQVALSAPLQAPLVLQQHLAIAEAAQSGQPADVGRALLSAEQLLMEEGRLSVEWGDVWQPLWCRYALEVTKNDCVCFPVYLTLFLLLLQGRCWVWRHAGPAAVHRRLAAAPAGST